MRVYTGTTGAGVFDFSQARGQLVASVPGVFRGREMHRWGHMRLRQLLRGEARLASRFDTVCCQFSSFGSLTQKWFDQDWLPSVSGGE